MYPAKLDSFLWEAYVSKIKDGKSFLFLKFHHSMSDGMGILGMLSLINSKATHKSVLVMNYRNLFQKLTHYLLLPYFFLKTMNEERKISYYPESHILRDVELIDAKIFLETKEWDFFEIQKKYKQFKHARFNDLMMSYISIALSKILKESGSKADKLIVAIPVNMRNPPKDIDDVVLTNVLSSSKVEFPIIDSIDQVETMRHKLHTAFNF